MMKGCRNVKKIIKSIAIVLLIALVSVNTPLSATTAPLSVAATTIENNSVSSSLTATPTVVSEEVSLREQGVKHFQLSDGTRRAVVYDEPVHYKQGNEWIEIDNSLVSASLIGEPLTGVIKRDTELTANEKQNILQSADTASRAYTTAYYENNANDFNVQLPKEINSNMPVVVNYSGHSLRFRFNDIARTTAEISQPKDATAVAQELQNELANTADNNLRVKIQNDFATAVQKNRSGISYPSVKNNIDLAYYVTGQSLKEDIVFHSLPAAESFSFEFTYTGLSAVLEEDKSVVFNDESGNPVFVVAAPCMFDSDEGYSSDILVTVEETNTGCRYTLTPDREWLSDEARVYPVTLDPQVTTTQNSSYIHDNGVQQSDPNTNYMTTDRMYIGSGPNSTQGRIYFKLTQWPSATGLTANNITTAYLNFSYYPQANWQTAYQTTIDVYRLSSSWDTSTITWNNQVGIGGTLISSKYIGDHRNWTGGYDDYDVTSWVKSHYSSPSTDYGIRLQPHTVASSTNRACYISSDYYTNTSLRPIIYINYYRFAGVKGVRNAPATSYKAYNCQSYAFWLTPVNGTNVFTDFTDSDLYYCLNTTTENALIRTKERMVSWLNRYFNGKWREVGSYDADLYSNEWLVCMRVGVMNGEYDYHYWYRASDGNWYNKHGYQAASEKVSGNVTNPSTANYSDGWALNGTYFYTSSTVYYAIQQ